MLNYSKLRNLLNIILCLLVLSASIMAQDDKNGEQKKKEKPKFKKYEEVVTEKAVTKKGVFVTHEVDDKLYYEIKEADLGKEFLWLTQFAKTQTSYGYGGTEVIRRVVRWERLKDNILLRNVEYVLRAKEGSNEEVAVKASSVEQIIKSFKIETFAEDKSPVIDVTDLFVGDTHEFSPKEALNARGGDKKRTFINSVKVFDENIETRVLATYNLKPATPNSNDRFSRRHSDPSLGSVTAELHHSMIELPENPMLPREFDKRVGYFAGTFQDYSSDEQHGVERVTYIKRWRLEKKNPNAEVSEPKKQIVYYVGRGVPEKWKKYVKEGIEMWQPVFEKAGFKNAIVGKYAPTEEEDPNWDAEDIRHSTVRWLPSTISNAYGPNVNDPRTGEILEADIRVYHNLFELLRNWYFVQASPNDPRAQKLPLPDDLMGDLLRYVVAHEVGHTIGLRHNFKSTYAYTTENLRDPEFTNKYGIEASIMDYGRFNYVAQPGDNALLIPIIGPYDYFAIEWGYKQFNGSKTSKEDKTYLNKIAERQLTDEKVRFSGGYEFGPVVGADPHARSEDYGRDPIKATTLGLKNLERVTKNLINATGQENKDYTLLNTMYGQVLGQMFREFGHVAALIGGIEIDNLMYGQGDEPIHPTPKNEQKAAMNFVLENGFKTPEYLLDKDIISKIGMHGVTESISDRQKRLLNTILSTGVAKRLIDVQSTGYENYTLAEMVTDLKNGVFEEIKESSPEINTFRRNLQRAFVDKLLTFLNGKETPNNDLEAVSRGTLLALQNDLKAAANKADDMTKFHLIDLEQLIQSSLKKN